MIYTLGIRRDPYRVTAQFGGTIRLSYHWDAGSEYNTANYVGRIAWALQWGAVCGVGGQGSVDFAYTSDPQVNIVQKASAWMGDGSSPTVTAGTTAYTKPDRMTSGDYPDGGYTANYGGTVELSVPADLCIEVLPVDDTYLASHEWFGPAWEPDDFPYGYRLFWRSVTGGTITATSHCGTVTQVVTGTVTPGSEFDLPEMAQVTCTSRIGPNAVATTQVVQFVGQSDGCPISAPEREDRDGNYVDGADGLVVCADGTHENVQGVLTAYKVREAVIDTCVTAMGSAYPNGLAIMTIPKATGGTPDTATATTITDGRGDINLSQSYYTWFADFNLGVMPPSPAADQETRSINERAPLQTWISSNSLSALGEDTDDTRLQGRCARWNAITLGQDATYPIDGGFTATGDTTRTVGVNLWSYRYLCIATNQTNAPITLTIGSKSWDGTTDGTGLVQYDLCSPTSETAQTDPKTSRWVDIDDELDPVDGPYWGVEVISSYRLSGMNPVGYVVGTNGVYLKRVASMQAHLMRTTKPWTPIQRTSTDTLTTTDYVRRFLQCDTDGRMSAEECALQKTVTVSTVSGTGTVYVNRTIEQFLEDEILSAGPRNPGFTGAVVPATDVADGSDYDYIGTAYANKNRSAFWLAGEGMTVASGTWDTTGCTGIACPASPATIAAQMLMDECWDYPAGIGDPFSVYDGDSTTENAPVRFAYGAVLRGGAWGLALAQAGTALADQAIGLYHGGSDARGAGTSSTTGRYSTGLPYSEGNAYATVKPVSEAMQVDCTPLRARNWRRACFKLTPPTRGEWVSIDRTGYNRFVRAYTSGGVVHTGWASPHALSTWSDTSAGFSAYHPIVRVERWHDRSRWRIIYEPIPSSGGGGVYPAGYTPEGFWPEGFWPASAAGTVASDTGILMRMSEDEGATWSVPVTVFGAGSYPACAIAPDGRQFYYACSGSSVIGLCLDPGGGTVRSFGTVLPTVTPGAIDAAVYVVQGQQVRVALAYQSGTAIAVATSPDGEVFA